MVSLIFTDREQPSMKSHIVSESMFTTLKACFTSFLQYIKSTGTIDLILMVACNENESTYTAFHICILFP